MTLSRFSPSEGFRLAPPRAPAMIEALRGLGYTTAAALADIVDNGVSAGAALVAVDFVWNGASSRVAILDDGCGMDEETLDSAMRLGERNPLDARKETDLGRFGLGLKTASFSQCRRLTVASLRDGHLACLRWDLDLLSSAPDGGWRLMEGAAPGSEAFLQPLIQAGRGTLVLWEVPDRMIGQGAAEQDFLDLIDQVETHLGMVFHRYLEGPRPRLRLTINGARTAPWDPFLLDHPATWSSPLQRVGYAGGVAEASCHVLPHKDRLTQQEEAAAAGPGGWIAQQGFYVYRNQRLLIAGSWLGLGQGRGWARDEAHRLARLRIDIPNSMDADWKIDIRKSTAAPPLGLRPHLGRLAEETRARARRVFAARGRPALSPGGRPILQAWSAQHGAEGIRYRIDREHPAVRSVLDGAGASAGAVKAMLRVIEETVPVQRIWLDAAEGREDPRPGFSSGEAPAELRAVLEAMYRNLVLRQGVSPQEARERLLHCEPFDNHPDLVAQLPEDPRQGREDAVRD